MTSDAHPAFPAPTDEVVDLCRDLLRIDTTNTGENATSAGERLAAEYVAEKLAEVGITPEIHESAPGRANVIARIPGADPSRGALLVHGHLDVVPADADEWSVHPFSGELRDGYLWGRGAIDMKDFDAMVLAVVRHWQRTGVRPPRDIVLAYTADEEAGSEYGAHYLVTRHRELFDGCTEGIGEVGGFSYTVDESQRLYLIETAQKGIDWLRLHAKGRPGHGSMVHDDNAVTALAEAVARIGRHRFPVVVTDTVRAFLEEVSEVLGIELDPEDPETAIAKLGPIANIIGATIRNTANPTRLAAGYKDNVIPAGPAPPSTAAACPASPSCWNGSCASWSARTSPSSTCNASPPWRPPSTATWSRRCPPRCAPRTRVPGRCRTCSPAVRTRRRSRRSASGVSGSRRCDCRPT
jgi:acetylornithine deacetylase/succinyl-diaminopimelate desuccinylase-like protein